MDSDLKYKFLHNLCCSVYASLSLSQLVNNDFMTPEELASKTTIDLATKQVSKAQATLVVAIAILLFTAVAPIISDTNFEKTFWVIVCFSLIFSLGYISNDKKV